MVARSKWSGVGFALLAGALASSPTSFAVEADTEAPRAPTAESTVYHTVAPGETLTAIAQQYRISIASLVRANEIADAQMIRAGTRLRIPASPEPAATVITSYSIHYTKLYESRSTTGNSQPRSVSSVRRSSDSK